MSLLCFITNYKVFFPKILNIRFIEKVKNGSCHWSNQFYKPWEKCGKLLDLDNDVFAMAAQEYLCYSKIQNLAFSSNTILSRYFYPYQQHISQLYLLLQFLILTILMFFILLVPEIPQVLELKKQYDCLANFRFLFSMRNQIILFSIMSTGIPLITTFISFFVNEIFDNFGNIFAFLIVTIQYLQILTLW